MLELVHSLFQEGVEPNLVIILRLYYVVALLDLGYLSLQLHILLEKVRVSLLQVLHLVDLDRGLSIHGLNLPQPFNILLYQLADFFL